MMCGLLVILPFSPIRSACDHGCYLRLGHPKVECTKLFLSIRFRLTRTMQPYLLLSRGHALADETLLVDYVG